MLFDVATALATLHGREAPGEALPHLAALLGADIAIYHRIDIAQQREDAAVYPDGASPAAHQEPDYRRYLGQDPLSAHYAATRSSMPCRLSDVLDRRQWHRHRVYNEYYRPFGIQHQMALPVGSGPGAVTAFTVCRSTGRDFDERDRSVSALLVPHLAQLHRQQVQRLLLERAHQLLATTSAAAAGVVVLDDEGRVVTTAGAVWLRLGDQLGLIVAGRPLPGPLRNELGALLPGPSDAMAPAPPTHTALLGGRVYVVRHTRLTASETAVVLEEQAPLLAPGKPPRNRGRLASLSDREFQVLELVAVGHTDAAIARHVGITASTVAKHLQKGYVKLGVRNRAAAVAVLRGGT